MPRTDLVVSSTEPYRWQRAWWGPPALAALISLVVGAVTVVDAPVASAQPDIPCAQWQQMHPGWPCIPVPKPPPPGPPSTPPPLPTAPMPGQPPADTGGGSRAGALTPPPVQPGNGTPIVPVPGAPDSVLRGNEPPAPAAPKQEPVPEQPPGSESPPPAAPTTLDWSALWHPAKFDFNPGKTFDIPLSPEQSHNLWDTYKFGSAGASAAACVAIFGPSGLGAALMGVVCGMLANYMADLIEPKANQYYIIHVKIGLLGPEVWVEMVNLVSGTPVPQTSAPGATAAPTNSGVPQPTNRSAQPPSATTTAPTPKPEPGTVVI